MSDSCSHDNNTLDQPVLEMTRRLTFSASYSDVGPDSGSRLGVHAHNYILDVRVRGAVEARTGIIINIKILDAIVRDRVVSHLDGRDITNHCAFEKSIPTLTALLDYIRGQLEDQMPGQIELSGLRLEETPTSWMEWIPKSGERRDRASMLLVTRSYEFSASHRLDSPSLTPEENVELFGKCNYANGHGHNYILEVTVEGNLDEHTGLVVDTEALDDIVNREIVDRYDHRHLNYDIPEFQGRIPSAEIITKVIWDRLEPQLPSSGRLYQILLRETARNIFQYNGEGR